MRSGAALVSPNGFVALRMQADGNLVMSAGAHVLFVSGTRGAGNYAQLGVDGNFTMYSAAHRLIFATYTRGTTNVLRVGDDGNLVLANRAGIVAWNSHTRAGALDSGGTLRNGQFLIGPSGDRLTQQSDGNLVLRRSNGQVRWNSQTNRHPGAYTILQGDGNLVTYTPNFQPLWYSGGAGAGAHLTIDPSGALSLRRANGSLRWASNLPVAPVAPVAAPVPQTAAQYASAVLQMWGGRVTGLPGVYSDLLATSRGQAITNGDSCGRSVRVDIRIVAFLYNVTSKYQIKINNIITGHGCDTGHHPKGEAVDIATAWNLSTAAATSFGGNSGANNLTMDTQFASYISTILPAGSGLGQSACAGTSSARLAPGIAFFPDFCNHQHVQV